MTVLICKGGSVFRSYGGISSGENGETRGAIEALVSAGFKVVYFGQWTGPPIEGVDIVHSHIDNLDFNSDPEYQKYLWKLDVTDLERFAPFSCFVNVAGYAPTFSCIDNPNGAKVQAAAIRYTAPMLNVIHSFNIPRVVCNCDPRTYPRDQEMSLMWPATTPVALLDQCDKDWHRVVGGSRFAIRSVHGRCESWGSFEHRENLREKPAVCVAHAHIKDGIGTGPVAAWKQVLADPLPKDFKVFGKGWNYFPDSRSIFFGELTTSAVFEVLRTASACPIVSHTPNFFTGKPWVCLSQGCAPLLWSGKEGCWDPTGKYVPLNHWSRLQNPGDLKRIAESINSDMTKELESLFVVDFSKLVSCVSDLESKRDFTSDSWWRDYGGYRL